MAELNKNSSLHPFRKLCPFVVNSVLRVGGRLQKSSMPVEFKHQVILPSKLHVTSLIVDYYHCREGHCGPQHVLAAIRERFWIMKGQSYVKNVINKGRKCRLTKAKPGIQIMAPLPPKRVTAGNPPFTCVGVDYMGPILVKRARSQVKRFGCIFTCLVTRAIHIKIAHALDTNVFLNAFTRFTARRGKVAKVISDNGSNLVEGERELREGIQRWNQARIQRDLSQKGIQWHFNPPGASHYGGVFKRMVQSIKRIMTRLVGNRVLDDDALHTFALEVERILNSRPITPLSDDPMDGACLTPNMLLNTKLDMCVAPDVFMKPDEYKKSWRLVQRLADLFWAK